MVTGRVYQHVMVALPRVSLCLNCFKPKGEISYTFPWKVYERSQAVYNNFDRCFLRLFPWNIRHLQNMIISILSYKVIIRRKIHIIWFYRTPAILLLHSFQKILQQYIYIILHLLYSLTCLNWKKFIFLLINI